MITCPKCGVKAGEIANCEGFCPMIIPKVITTPEQRRVQALVEPAPVDPATDFDFDFFDEVLA